jgi:hypothetical protein
LAATGAKLHSLTTIGIHDVIALHPGITGLSAVQPVFEVTEYSMLRRRTRVCLRPTKRPNLGCVIRTIIISTLPGGSPSLVLLVSPRIEDHVSLQGILLGSRWKMEGARTACDGLAMIRRNHCEIAVVICEYRLPDGDWRLVLAELLALAVRPALIVCSRLADERLWVEVLNLGGFDLLLCAPFVPEEVLRVTESAWSARSRAARLAGLSRKAPGFAAEQAHIAARALAASS